MAVVPMTGPALDGWRFLCACLLGLILGVIYGFLRPLRQRRPIFADIIFLPFLGYTWLYLGFALCRGDLRLGYCAGLPIGAAAWELTVGRLLRPIFAGFWHLIFRISLGIAHNFEKIYKKIKKNFKNVFALWKKWYTIVETNRRSMRRKNGGAPKGEKEKLF